MNADELTNHLRTLPPPLHAPPDRFAAVEQRARRRARTVHTAIGGAITATAAVVTATVLLSGNPTTHSDGPSLATEPPAQTEDVTPGQAEPLPGATTAIDVSEPVEVTAPGTTTVHLGPRPDGATAARVSVVCLTPGRIEYPDGASIACDRPAPASQIADPRSSGYALIRLRPGQTSLKFKARQDVDWKVVATYVRTETSQWGVNAKGETYGVQRNGKSPDLLAVITTDGRQGYAYVKDLNGPEPPASPDDALAWQEAQEGRTRSVPVYESDGETLIGEYAAHGGSSR